jgi:hypothetical protein
MHEPDFAQKWKNATLHVTCLSIKNVILNDPERSIVESKDDNPKSKGRKPKPPPFLYGEAVCPSAGV